MSSAFPPACTTRPRPYPGLRDRYFGRYRKLAYLAQSHDPEIEARARRAARRLGLAFEMRYTGYGGYERFLAARAACPKPAARKA